MILMKLRSIRAGRLRYPRKNKKSSKMDEYYYHEIIGCRVHDRDRRGAWDDYGNIKSQARMMYGLLNVPKGQVSLYCCRLLMRLLLR